MKIQRTNYKGNVQNLGRKDFSAPMRLANLKASNTNRLAEMDVALVQSRNSAVQSVIDQSANEIHKLRDDAIRDEAQSNLAKSQFGLSKHLQDVEQKQYFKADEIPVSMRSGVSQYGDMIPRSKVQAGLLKDYMQEEQSRLKESMSPQAYDIWAKAMEGNFGTAELDTQNAIFQGEITLRKQKAGEVVDVYVENLDSVSAVKYINDSPLYSPAEKKVLIEKTRQKVAKENIYQAIETGDPQKMFAEHEHLNDPGYQGVLTGPARTNLSSVLKLEIGRATKSHAAALSRANALDVSELEIAISRGQATYEDIDNMYNAGKLTGAKRTQSIKSLDAYHIKKSAENVSATRLSNVISGRALPDPFDTDLIAAANREYIANPESGLHVTIKTGIMPSGMVSDLNAVAFSGSSEDRIKGSNLMEKLAREKPISLRKIPKQTQAIYEVVGQLSPLVEPKEIQKIVDGIRNQSAVELQQRQLRYKEVKPLDDLDGLMDADPLFDVNTGPYAEVKASDLPDNITGDYLLLHEKYFLMTGSEEAASKLAHKGVRAIYSATRINGEWQVMKYAPGREHNLPAEVISQDFTRFRKAKGYSGAYLVSDHQTAVEKSKTYAVFTLDEFGLPVEQPIRYTPDREKILTAIKAESDREEMEAARATEERTKRRRELMEQTSLFKSGGLIDKTKEFLRHKDVDDPAHSSQKRKPVL